MNDREKVICPLAKFAMKVLTTERTKTGGNAIVAKTWQEQLSQSGKNRAIARGRIYLRLNVDNYIKPRNAIRRMSFIK